MKVYFFAFIVLVFCTNLALAQDSLSFNKRYIAKNNLSLELGGIAGFESINYERNFCIKDNSFHTLRAGFSYLPYITTEFNQVLLPLAYTYSIVKKKSKFFVGMGLTLLIAPNPYPATFAERKQVREHPTAANSQGYEPLLDLWLCPMVGYEFISKKAFYFRAYISGMLFRNYGPFTYGILPWGGFTFGLKLKNRK